MSYYILIGFLYAMVALVFNPGVLTGATRKDTVKNVAWFVVFGFILWPIGVGYSMYLDWKEANEQERVESADV